MTRVILVRHGETTWNEEGRFQGHIDVELNDKGTKQAKAVAARLGEMQIDAVYSSPLKRSMATAKLIADYRNLEPIVEEGFVEINHGRWEGLHLKDVQREHKELYQKWLEHPKDAVMPGGESLTHVRERAVAAFRKVLTGQDGKTIVIVGHDAVNKILICECLGLDNSHFWQIKQSNGGISVVDYQSGQFKLMVLNDTCHLGSLLEQTKPGAMW